MSDIQSKTLEIVLKGRDDGASKLLDSVGRKAGTLAQQLRQGGDIGEIGAIKKFGKNIGEFVGTGQSAEISKGADQLRAQATANYGEEVRKVVEIERTALAMDQARAGAISERTRAERALADELKSIAATTRSQLRGVTDEPRKSEIRDDADMNRAAALKNYQDVAARTAEIEKASVATDKARKESIDQKTAAGRRYAEQLKKISEAEREAQKAARAENRVARGVAVAGGTLLAIRAAGELAKAYEAANEKLEKGEIAAGEFIAEWAKGTPIIGGVVKSAESLLLTVTGIASETRKANAEAAKLDKVINDRNAARKNVDTTVSKFAGVDDTQRQALQRKAAADLAEIKKARDEAAAAGVLGDGNNDRGRALANAEKNVRSKLAKELADIDLGIYRDRVKKHEAATDAILASERNVIQIQTGLVVQGLEDQGRMLDAKITEIRAKTQADLEAIQQKRVELGRETGLTDQDRIARQNALDKETDAIKARGASEETATRKTAAESAAERVYDIQRKIVQAQIAGGDKAAERESKRLDILKEMYETQKAIDELLKDSGLTADQRASLIAQRAQLPGLADKQIAGINRVDPSESLRNQLSQRVTAFDGRGQTRFLQQQGEVKLTAEKKTEDNTKATEKSTKATEDLKKTIDKLVEKLNSTPPSDNAGFIG